MFIKGDVMRRSLRAIAAIALAGSAILGLAAPASAQSNYPERPITMLVGFPAGGNVDIAARLSAPFLEKYLGNGARIVVVNKPGAAGVLMLNDLATSRPDGHTIGVLSLPGMVTAMIDSRPRYDTDSFTYLGGLTDEPYTFFVGPNSPYRTLADLVKAAREQPGAIVIGGAGIGSAPHLAAVAWQRASGLRFTWAPLPGAAQSVTAVQGGHVVGAISSVSLTVRIHNDRRVRIIGLMDDERWSRTPDIPTFKESGFDVVAGAARGFGGPRGMPEAIVRRWDEAIQKTANDPQFRALADRDFVIVRHQTAAGFRTYVKQQETNFRAIWNAQPWR